MSEAKTLLEYVPERLEDLERIQAEQDAARTEAGRIRIEIERAEIALSQRRAELVKPDRSRVLAAAVLAGEPPPPEPADPPGVAPEELEATIRGLRVMREEAEKRIEDARAALRGKTIQAFREAAEHAAVDFVAAALRVGELHAEIGAAQRFVESLGSSHSPGIIVGHDWFDLTIPSSDQLAALRPVTRMSYFKPMIVGGDSPGLHNAAAEAFEEAKREVRRRLGGRWPLDRVF